MVNLDRINYDRTLLAPASEEVLDVATVLLAVPVLRLIGCAVHLGDALNVSLCAVVSAWSGRACVRCTAPEASSLS